MKPRSFMLPSVYRIYKTSSICSKLQLILREKCTCRRLLFMVSTLNLLLYRKKPKKSWCYCEKIEIAAMKWRKHWWTKVFEYKYPAQQLSTKQQTTVVTYQREASSLLDTYNWNTISSAMTTSPSHHSYDCWISIYQFLQFL